MNGGSHENRLDQPDCVVRVGRADRHLLAVDCGDGAVMTDRNKDGDHPALPITAGNQVYAQGMSIRDYAAIHFMSALISTEAGMSNISKVAKESGLSGGLCAAGAAYEFADALMMLGSAKK